MTDGERKDHCGVGISEQRKNYICDHTGNCHLRYLQLHSHCPVHRSERARSPRDLSQRKSEDLGSVGIPLSKTEIETGTVIQNLVTVKARQNFGFIGYRTGENKYTYPKYGRAKAEALLETLCSIADYVIVDCPSNPENDPLALTALELSWQTLRLATPDLECISWYISQAPLFKDSKVKWDEQIQGINTPNADVFMPVEEARSHLKDVSFTVHFSRAIKEQMQKGTLYEPSADKAYNTRMKEIAEKVVTYGQD